MTTDGTVDPVDLPGFFPNRPRPVNQTRMDRIEALAEHYHFLKEELDKARELLGCEVKAAKEAGHSYNQLAERAGVAIGTIQRMVEGRWR